MLVKFLLIVLIIAACRATTEIFYVQPDGNSSNEICPSQPCVTLTQYLTANGTVSVTSNVEYRLLPGEHYINTDMKMWGLSNFSFIGITDNHLLSVVEFNCWSKFAISIFDSCNVTIANIVFKQCKGNSDFHTSLVLVDCVNCRIMYVTFLGYGLTCKNLLGESYLSNINIDMSKETPSIDACDVKLSVFFMDRDTNYESVVTINQLVISGGYSDFCQQHIAVQLNLLQTRSRVFVKLTNSWFHDLDRSPLHVITQYDSDNTIIVKNCTFEHFKHVSIYHYEMIQAIISNLNTTLSFENCKFNSNTNFARHITIQLYGINSFCVNPTKISFVNCDFVNNHRGMILSLKGDHACAASIYFNGSINFLQNKMGRLIGMSNLSVHFNGAVTISRNQIYDSILELISCNVIISNKVTFSSNFGQQVINLQLINYFTLMQYTSIIFTGNVVSNKIMLIETSTVDEFVYPFCFFQYATLTIKSNVSLIHYAITFNNNIIFNDINDPNNDNLINGYLTHCEWLPTAAFYGANPGEINQQIIKVDGTNWTHHNRICYCFQNGTNNCNIDVFGPVYPGQTFHVNLCIPEAKSYYFVYVETHAAAALPNSACKTTHQHEYIYEIRNYSTRINFTVASESQRECELFLTSWPNTWASTAFYVKLLPCPIGFTLQNGICDCDPLLPSIIKACYISRSAMIRRPANTWITFHTTQVNQTEYLMSDCPLDYCLPYSSDVDLLDPDLQCQFNRTGMLCSQCQPHLSMVFGSSRCMECTNVHILITLIILVAGIILVVLLYLLNLTVTIGTINGIIFYANIISINDSVFLVNNNVFKPLRVFISFINLNIGIETCFYNGMDSYAKIWLQIFFPFYLIFISVLIIILSRFSFKILRLTFTRSFSVLATVCLLSYSYILRITLTVLFSYSTITSIHVQSGHRRIVWSFDASLPLFGFKFTVLFIICLILFLLTVFFIIILFYTKYLSKYRYFKALLSSYQASYKDEYSYWIAVDIILRSLLFILYAFQRRLRLILITIILVLYIGYYGYVHPNKYRLVHIQELLLLVNLITIHAISYQDSYTIFSVVTNLMISVAFVQFCIIVLYHFLTYTCRWNVADKLQTIRDKLATYISNKRMQRRT